MAKKQAAQGKIDPERVRLLIGDPVLVGRQLATIQKEWVGEDPLFGALDVLYGDRADIEAIGTAVRTASLAGRRLVVLRMVDRLKDDVQRELLLLCPDVSADTRLLLVAESPDLRRTLFAALKKAGCIETVGPQTKDTRKALPEWKSLLFKLAGEKGLKLAPDAAEAVLEYVIGDTGRLENELEKLSLRHGKDRVELAEALLSLGGERVRTAFALSGAIRERRMGRALVELRRAIGQGAAPEVLIGEMAGEFRALLRARALLDEGMGEAAAKKAFGGGRGFFVVPKAKNYRRRELLVMIQELARIDVRAKRGVAPQAPIEALFLQIGQRRLARPQGGP
ncbi:MAG: DNA polymerase III subunit delta [Deltaproteobacteria bacterium]